MGSLPLAMPPVSAIAARLADGIADANASAEGTGQFPPASAAPKVYLPWQLETHGGALVFSKIPAPQNLSDETAVCLKIKRGTLLGQASAPPLANHPQFSMFNLKA
jgi:hypothetical protein